MQRSSRAALDVACVFIEKKGATLGLYWGKCDEMDSCSIQLLLGENFLASINSWEATELRRNQYQYQDKHVRKSKIGLNITT